MDMNGPDRRQDQDIREAAHEWRTAVSRPGVSEEELARFEAWQEADELHKDAYERAETVWDALGSLRSTDLDDDFLKPSWRERLPGCFFAWSSTGKTFRLRTIAAASVILVGLAAITMTLMTEKPAPDIVGPTMTRLASQAGEIRTVMLADGSAVTLGAKTEIAVTISDAARDVHLIAGAALFSVAEDADRPFVVRAGELTATAVGTEFDVRNNGGVARVAVTEGVVEVRYPLIRHGKDTAMSDRRLLRAGQRVAATGLDGLRSTESVPVGSIGAWRANRLRYSGASLAELVADARRHSGQTIVIEDAARELVGQKVTAFFDGSDIDGMLATLPDILPVVVDQTDPTVTVIRPRADD